MTVVCPCDANEMGLAVAVLLDYNGPAYLPACFGFTPETLAEKAKLAILKKKH